MVPTVKCYGRTYRDPDEARIAWQQTASIISKTGPIEIGVFCIWDPHMESCAVIVVGPDAHPDLLPSGEPYEVTPQVQEALWERHSQERPQDQDQITVGRYGFGQGIPIPLPPEEGDP